MPTREHLVTIPRIQTNMKTSWPPPSSTLAFITQECSSRIGERFRCSDPAIHQTCHREAWVPLQGRISGTQVKLASMKDRHVNLLRYVNVKDLKRRSRSYYWIGLVKSS